MHEATRLCKRFSGPPIVLKLSTTRYLSSPKKGGRIARIGPNVF